MFLSGWRNKRRHRNATSCLACGDCCREFSWHLVASNRDLDRWREHGRTDLLRRVNRLGWIWVDPSTKERERICPFLEETGAGTARCMIHDIKPDICRAYPTHATHHRCIRGRHLQ